MVLLSHPVAHTGAGSGQAWLAAKHCAGVGRVQDAHLEQDLLQAGQGPAKAHVVAHALGLPAEHGRVRAEAGLEFGLGQQVHPDDLP